MRDSSLREAEPGSEASNEEKEAWQELQQLFLKASGAIPEPAKKAATGERLTGRPKQRLSAYYHLIACDHMLEAVLPGGLRTFVPQPQETPACRCTDMVPLLPTAALTARFLNCPRLPKPCSPCLT